MQQRKLSDSSEPDIGIIVPVYNAGRYLQKAIDSIFSQSFTRWELILVDDGSTDRSLELMKAAEAHDSRVHVVSRPNTGIVGALNDGLAHTRAQYVARMDADDICHPQRLERQLAYMNANPEVVCVGTSFYYIDSEDHFICRSPRPKTHEEIETELLRGNGGAIIHPSVLFRRTALEKVGGYRQEAIWIEDLDLYLRLACIGRLANLTEALLWYRIHEKSVNFTQNNGRYQRKLTIMQQAYAARGLDFRESQIPPPSYSKNIQLSRLLDFAVSSLDFGKLGRPTHWMLRALFTAPCNRNVWKTISYVTQAKFGIIKVCSRIPLNEC